MKSITTLGLVALFFCIVGLSGCQYPPVTHVGIASKETGPQWFTYDASRRGAFLLRDDSGVARIVAEPAPDVAIQQTAELLAQIGTDDIASEQVRAKLASEIVQLGKRTTAIMFLREALYRLAELAQNNDVDTGEIVAQYAQVIRTAAELVAAETAEAQGLRTRQEAILAAVEALQTALATNASADEGNAAVQRAAGALEDVLKTPTGGSRRIYEARVTGIGPSAAGRGFSLYSIVIQLPGMSPAVKSRGVPLTKQWMMDTDGPDRNWISNLTLPVYVGEFEVEGADDALDALSAAVEVKLHQGDTPEVQLGEGERVMSGAASGRLDGTIEVSVRMNNAATVPVFVELKRVK